MNEEPASQTVVDGNASTGEVVVLGPLLDAIVTFVKRFVVLTLAQARVVALWVVHTHAIDVAAATPFLAITSPEKQSGKTRLLEVLALLCHKPWHAITPSEAVLYRKIERDCPTLLLDEVDTIFGSRPKDHEGLRSLLNSGNRRGAVVPRCEGPKSRVKDFSVFCARALAGIGRLPDTITDRSIPIQMSRRARGESVERFGAQGRRNAENDAKELRGRVALWVQSQRDALKEITPELPEALSDRAQDGAEPLLAIADAAGGEWSKQAREALLELYGKTSPEDDSIGVRLLTDIRRVFHERKTDRLSSKDLCDALSDVETSPWGDWYGKPITPRGLASRLKDYGICPDQIRLSETTTCKGYMVAWFKEVWTRYLPLSKEPFEPHVSTGIAHEPKQPKQASTGAGSRPVSDPKPTPTVSDIGGGNSATISVAVSGVSGEPVRWDDPPPLQELLKLLDLPADDFDDGAAPSFTREPEEDVVGVCG